MLMALLWVVIGVSVFIGLLFWGNWYAQKWDL